MKSYMCFGCANRIRCLSYGDTCKKYRVQQFVDNILHRVQSFSYSFLTRKIGNAIMDFRKKYTLGW